MGYLNRVIRRIRQGALRDIMEETRWIYGYAKKYRGQILVYILLGLCATGVGLGAGLVSRSLINLVITGRAASGRRIAEVAGAYVALGLGKILLGAVNGRVSARVNLHVNREIRADVFSRFMNTGWSSISAYHTGDLLLRLDKDVATVASSVLGWIPSLVTGLVQFFGALGVILFFDPSMALFALLGVPLSTGLMGGLAPKIRECGTVVQEAAADLNSFYTDSLQNIQSVKAFGLVDSFSERLGTLQKRHVSVSLEQNRVSVLSGVIMSLAGMLSSYLCLGWGVYRLWTGKIDFGTMVLFIQLAGYLSSAASGLVKLGPGVINAAVSAKRIMTILDLPAEQVTPVEEMETLKTSPEGVTVSVKDLSFGYGAGEKVLRDVDFQASPGQVTAVIGASGSGKTTLLRLLLSLLSPDQGQVCLSAGEIHVEMQPGLRQLFSYVPQQKALFSGTVAETLRMVKPEAKDGELWQVLELVEMADVVRKLPNGLNSSIGEDGGLLSQGQGQRLSIARALLRDAPVLLLDEATSALDVETEQRVLERILKYSKNRTVILTTHRPTVLRSCRNVYEIREGRGIMHRNENSHEASGED